MPEDVNLNPSTGEPREWWALLAKLRDAAVFIIAATYALGHIVWAIYADHFGLGLNPAVQAQYFVAGAPAFVTIGLVAVIFFRGPYWLSHLRTLAVENYGQRAHIVIALLGLMGIVTAFEIATELASIEFVGPVLMGIAALLAQTIAIVLLHESRAAYRLMIAFVMMVCIGCLWAYSILLYPRLPQAFGGGRPQCVMLTISESSVTPEWRRLAVDAKIAALYNLRQRDPSGMLKAIADAKAAELRQLRADDASAHEFATAGPLKLWVSDGSQLLVSSGWRQDDLYLLPRTPGTVIRFVSDNHDVDCPDD